MALSPAELCNVALSRIGNRQFIDSLDENSTQGKVCKAIYAHSRDVVLASFPWQFAMRRSTLAALSTTTRSGWTYVYGAPSDMVAARYVWNGGVRNIGAEERVPFAVEGDAASGLLILSDMKAAELVYTARIEATGLFPPLFADALVWKLAAELALSLPIKPQVGVAMAQAHDRALAKAGAADLRQGQGDVQPDSEFIRVR